MDDTQRCSVVRSSWPPTEPVRAEGADRAECTGKLGKSGPPSHLPGSLPGPTMRRCSRTHAGAAAFVDAATGTRTPPLAGLIASAAFPRRQYLLVEKISGRSHRLDARRRPGTMSRCDRVGRR